MSQLPHKRSAILSWARTHRVHVADTASIQWDEADKVYVVNGVVRVPAWRVEARRAGIDSVPGEVMNIGCHPWSSCHSCYLPRSRQVCFAF
jgi:hypothetical protein